MPTASSPPPRIQAFMASQAPYTLFLRRGPTRHVCTIGWQRDRDHFERGQWFKGRIYEDRSDLSPDGRHFIYFAAKHAQWQSENKGTWTAISRTPYLKAISMWPKGDTWYGGGHFLDNRTVLVNGGHENPLIQNGKIEAKCLPTEFMTAKYAENYTPPQGISLITKQDLEKYGETDKPSRKNGWSFLKTTTAPTDKKNRNHKDNPKEKACWGKYVSKYWFLRQPAGQHGFQLLGRYHDNIIDLPPGTSWAESDDYGDWTKLRANVRIVWICEGVLYGAELNKKTLEAPRILFDFNPLTFERLKAPY